MSQTCGSSKNRRAGLLAEARGARRGDGVDSRRPLVPVLASGCIAPTLVCARRIAPHFATTGGAGDS